MYVWKCLGATETNETYLYLMRTFSILCCNIYAVLLCDLPNSDLHEERSVFVHLL